MVVYSPVYRIFLIPHCAEVEKKWHSILQKIKVVYCVSFSVQRDVKALKLAQQFFMVRLSESESALLAKHLITHKHHTGNAYTIYRQHTMHNIWVLYRLNTGNNVQNVHTECILYIVHGHSLFVQYSVYRCKARRDSYLRNMWIFLQQMIQYSSATYKSDCVR